MLEDVDNVAMEDDKKVEDEAKKSDVPSLDAGNVDGTEARGEETPHPLDGTVSTAKKNATQKSIPPPGNGKKIYEIDPLLVGFRDHLDYR